MALDRLVWMGFNLLLLVVFPTFIAPLFNKFEPLSDDALKTRIEVLLRKCGFASKGLFVMDGSRRSAHGNAYFTGFGAAKRIVFFDTLLARLSGDEIEAVLAHELGHFKRHHVAKRIVVTFALSPVFRPCWAGCRRARGSIPDWACCPTRAPQTMRWHWCCSS